MIDRKKLIYAILNEVVKMSDVIYKGETFDVDEELFVQTMRLINNEGYITNMKITTNIIGGVHITFSYGKPVISERGLGYLKENSLLAKTYGGLKELRSWLPL